MLDCNLIPLLSLLVEIVNIESVKIAESNSVTIEAGCSDGEFFAFFIRGVVESLKQISHAIVEGYFRVVSSSSDLLPKG